MKICSKCKLTKLETEYFVKDKKKGRLHAECKNCYREHRKVYYQEHYQKYGDEYRLRAKKRRDIIRADLKSRMKKYLCDKKCEMCGENDIVVLDFDHIIPKNKSFSIASGIRNGKNWDDILKEIKKCRILCANCHRRVTAKQNDWYRDTSH